MSLFPVSVREPERRVEVASTTDLVGLASDKYNGWNACQQAGGRFVGIVRRTAFDVEGPTEHVVEMTHISHDVLITDKDGKTVQRSTPALRTIKASVLNVTRDLCAGQ